MGSRKKRLDIVFVLDGTGSMSSVQDQTLSAVNEYIETVKKAKEIDGNSTFSLSVFRQPMGNPKPTSTVEKIRDKVPLNKLEPLKPKEYECFGMTPLLDAVGSTLSTVKAKKGAATIVVMTDGLENASTEYKLAQVKELVEKAKANEWNVIFLGADIDAFAASAGLGTNVGTTMSVGKHKLAETMSSVAASTRRYASGGVAQAAFTEEERKESGK